MRISFTAIETFKQCPQKYKFKYIDRKRAPKSIEAVFGNLIHNVLKFLHSKNPLLPTQEEVLNFYKENWPSSNEVKWKDQNEEISYFNQGVKILIDYYNKNKNLDSKILALESPFELILKSNQEEHILSGKIDRIDKIKDDLFEIIDYKTTKTMPPQESVDNNLQLSVYYLGILNRWPSLKNATIKVSLYFLKHGEKLSAFIDNEKSEITKEKILSVINDIKKSDFYPLPSSLCDWCGYKNICPMWKHQFEQDYTEEEIKKAARELFLLSNEIKQNKKRLMELKNIINDYCNKNNLERVFFDEGYITRNLKIIYEYNIEKIKPILESVGLWKDLLSLDKNKLKMIFKKLPLSIKMEIENNKIVSKKIKTLSLKRLKKNSQ